MVERQELLIRKIRSLPEDALLRLEEFVEALKSELTGCAPKVPAPTLGGLWERYGPVTDQEIARWRKEMWGNFGARGL